MSLTRTLAETLVHTRFEDLPPETLELARQVCLDGLGVMIAGAREPLGLGRLVVEYTLRLGGTPEASVVSGGFKTSALNAAYANGTLCHALDFDNSMWPTNHPTSPTLPAILALAERGHLTGREVLLALVLAFEVQGRMRLASSRIQQGKGFHKPGVSGTMGATAAAGKLLGLDVQPFCMAFGIAGSRCGSISPNTGTMTKSTHSGHAARMGVEAAMLAGMGWTATDDVFGQGGFFDLFYGPGNYDLDLFLKDFGNPYRMISPGVGFKLYPCNGTTQKAVVAALTLARENEVRPEEIESVEVDFGRFDYINRPEPRTGLEGKFSVQYVTAAALLDRRITVETFADRRRFAPDLVALLPRIRMNVRDDFPRESAYAIAITRVAMRDGRRLEARCDRLPGSMHLPPTREQRLTKFRDCALPALPGAEVEELIELAERMEELESVSRIMEIVRGAGGLAKS